MNEKRERGFVERLDDQRTEIFKAMSIVEACRMGSDSMLATADTTDDDEEAKEPNFEGALAVAWTILNKACSEIEAVMKALQDEARLATRTRT